MTRYCIVNFHSSAAALMGTRSALEWFSIFTCFILAHMCTSPKHTISKLMCCKRLAAVAGCCSEEPTAHLATECIWLLKIVSQSRVKMCEVHTATLTVDDHTSTCFHPLQERQKLPAAGAKRKVPDSGSTAADDAEHRAKVRTRHASALQLAKR